MPKGQKTRISKEDYRKVAEDAGSVIVSQANILSQIGTFLGKSEDFSAAILDLIDKVDTRALRAACRAVKETSLKRGETYFDEQKEAWLERKLRLNRRDDDSED